MCSMTCSGCTKVKRFVGPKDEPTAVICTKDSRINTLNEKEYFVTLDLYKKKIGLSISIRCCIKSGTSKDIRNMYMGVEVIIIKVYMNKFTPVKFCLRMSLSGHVTYYL